MREHHKNTRTANTEKIARLRAEAESNRNCPSVSWKTVGLHFPVLNNHTADPAASSLLHIQQKRVSSWTKYFLTVDQGKHPSYNFTAPGMCDAGNEGALSSKCDVSRRDILSSPPKHLGIDSRQILSFPSYKLTFRSCCCIRQFK